MMQAQLWLHHAVVASFALSRSCQDWEEVFYFYFFISF